MDKHIRKVVLALLMAALLASNMCLSGCDLFGVGSDDGSIAESLDPSQGSSTDDIPSDTGLENPDDPDDPTIKNYDNGIMYPEEAEGVEVKLKKATGSDFAGSWEAKSGNAHYLFGNLELKIGKSGIWTGNITEEDYRGTWKEKNGGIYITSNNFEAQLNFVDKDKILLRYTPYEDSDSYVSVILTKA